MKEDPITWQVEITKENGEPLNPNEQAIWEMLEKKMKPPWYLRWLF